MKYYRDDWLTIYQGDVRAVLPEIAADSVDCIVTSPPYWGLRDYGTAAWDGGDEDCDHVQRMARGDAGRVSTDDRGPGINPTPVQTPIGFRHVCGKCGAIRQDSQLGLERTPEEYVANLVGVFRELRRVLKPSGTAWLNLGDSFGDKQLVGIPWRVAFALQADSWYLRSDIIWAKPNPMPESVTDRPTKAHEYLFLLTKSARYYYDADAVREPHQPSSLNRYTYKPSSYDNPAGRNLRSVWTIATKPYPGAHFAVFPPELPERCIKAGSSERGVCPECGAPWERVVEREPGLESKRQYEDGLRGRRTGGSTNGYKGVGLARYEVIGWHPSCRHYDAGWEGLPPLQPAVVLDPFAGSGTTGMVANRLSRRAILVDLNGDYLKQQLERNAQTPLGLAHG